MDLGALLSLLFGGLLLTYSIFLLMYLHKSRQCDKTMKKRDRDFRKAAYVITWVQVILLGLLVLASLLSLLSGRRVTSDMLVSGALGAVSPSSESSLV